MLSKSEQKFVSETSDSQQRIGFRPVCIFLGILLIVGLCGTLLFIRSESFLDWVEERLEAELRNQINVDHIVDVGNIEGNILGSVSIRSLSISKRGEPDPPIISTGKVIFKYNLLGLLNRKFEVKHLEVTEPRIHAVRDADGSLNLEQIFEQRNTPQEPAESQDTSQFDFAAGRIKCKRGSIAYIDEQHDLRFGINGITIDVKGELSTWDHNGTLEVDSGSIAFNGTEKAIDDFSADFVLAANAKSTPNVPVAFGQLNNLRLTFGNSDLRVTGELRQEKNSVSWDGTLNLELDVSDVQHFFDEEIELEGILTVKAEAQGTDSALNVKTLSADMPTFSMVRAADGRKVALAALAIDAHLKHSPTPTFEVTTFSAQIADGTLKANASVTLENPPKGKRLTQLRQLTQSPFNYAGEWRATEIQLIPLLSMFVELPENLSDSAGHLSGTAKFSGNSTDLSRFNLNSEIALIETTLDEVLLEDSTLNCTIAAGELKANGNFDETAIEITAPFPLQQQHTCDIQVSNLNFDKLMKIVNSSDFGGIGTSSAQLSSDGTLRGFLEVPDATFNDIPIGVLTGNYRYQEGQVSIENGLLTKNTKSDEVTPYVSRATINGIVDIHKDEFRTVCSIVADPVYVEHYPKLLLGGEYPVDAELRGELKLDGTLINLDGRADFRVTAGVAWGIHLDPLTLPLKIEDYNLSIPNFKITTRGQHLTMNAAVAANGDFDLRIENDAPVRFEEIAKAANIPDFPFEGAFDVRVVGIQKKPADFDFQVELDFSDITYLDNTRGIKHRLGDAYLLGKLIEQKRTTGEPDLYDFRGHGFDGTSRIKGVVSTAVDTPYRFVVESDDIDVAPFLRPLHPTLEAVTGTADGRVAISGTIADLAPPEFSEVPRPERVYPYDVDIHIATSNLRYGNPTVQENSFPDKGDLGGSDNADLEGFRFTNTEPIRLHLRDDIWSIKTLALAALDMKQAANLIDKNPFIELAGNFDAKTEVMNFQGESDGFALPPFAPVLGLPDTILQSGTARYLLHITGTPEMPVLALEWKIPTLVLKTEVGNIDISDAGGTITYKQETLRFAGCVCKVFGNDLNLGGYIDVQPEAFNNSELHLRVDTITLDLTTLPMASIDDLRSGNGITGVLEASVEIGGTLTEPLVLLYAETALRQPIRLASYIPSITLDRLRVDIDFDSESVHVKTLEANGQMGEGPYRAEGEAVFSRQEPNTMQFGINVSASQVEIGDYGTASGYVNLNGTGLDPQQMTLIGEINELTLDGYDFHLTNSGPLRFRSDPGETTAEVEALAVHIPLQLASPTMTVSTDVSIGGTLDAPIIAAEWNGTLNEKAWTGNVHYSDRQIEFLGITLKDGVDTLTLTGVIPVNLAFTTMDISERHLGEPIDLRLRGSELPIDFFPGTNTLFSQTEGSVDIDVALHGTTRSPHLVGNVLLEALRLDLKNFHEPIRNMKAQLRASENRVEVRNFQFQIGSGSCTLQQGQLALSGLVPKEFTLEAMRFEKFPLGSTLQQALLQSASVDSNRQEIVEDIEGHLTVGLKTLTVPLDRFFTDGEAMPLPQIREVPSLVDLVAVSDASLSIDAVQLAFRALDRYYDFRNPQPVPIVLTDGSVTLGSTFSLENQKAFLIKQTFSSEDAKPEGLIGDEQTISGVTTLRIDEASSWSVDDKFDVALRLANFDVSALTDTWPLAYRVTGALSGSLQLSGTSENPKITLRRHTSDPAELYLHDVPIDLRWRVRYQNGKWEITKKRYVEVTFGENLLTFSWTMPYQLELIPFLTRLQQEPETVWQELQQTPMDGILDIIVRDLDMLPLAVTGLGSASGTGEIRMELTGTLEAPQAIGSVFFNNMELDFSESGIYVKGAKGRVQLSEKGASITEFAGTLNGGNFSMRGSISAPPDRRIWQTPPTLDVSASLAEVVFEQSEAYQANFNSAELRLHGELLRPYLTGDLNIGGGYYQQNWETVRDWFTGASIGEADIALDYPILRDLYLDVGINIPGNFRVLASITGPTDVEVACLGRLVGPVNQPVFSGDVSLRGGKVGLVLQPFEVIEGSTISNRDTFNFDPELNIHLRTPTRIRGVLPRDESIIDIQVHAAFTGTLSNPNFTLSAPTATTAEVLTHEDIITFLARNNAISRTFRGFTFSIQRPFEADSRYLGEYPLGENISIKVETNDQGEHGIDFELKGRF